MASTQATERFFWATGLSAVDPQWAWVPGESGFREYARVFRLPHWLGDTTWWCVAGTSCAESPAQPPITLLWCPWTLLRSTDEVYLSISTLELRNKEIREIWPGGSSLAQWWQASWKKPRENKNANFACSVMWQFSSLKKYLFWNNLRCTGSREDGTKRAHIAVSSFPDRYHLRDSRTTSKPERWHWYCLQG